MWVLDEIRLAEQKGYELLEVHVVYKYLMTRYDPQTGNGGLLAQIYPHLPETKG